MGVFSRKNKQAKVEEVEEEKTTKVVENVRKADGSIVQETYIEFPEKIEFQQSEEKYKPQVHVSQYPVSPIREDSMGSFSVSKGQTRASIIADLMPEYDDDDDQSGKSMHLRRKWKSSRLTPGEIYEKPWVKEKIPHRSWERYIFALGCLLGAGVGAYLLVTSYLSVTNSEYCLLVEDHFDGINTEVWNFEVQRGGFGTGSFDWTTTDQRNVYCDEAGLHIVPTLTVNDTNISEAELLNGAVLNLTTAGTCTSTDINACSIRSNATSGTIINPVRSARLNTQGKISIKYGKVEVVAKLPKGDWLWPAIWMMPEDSVYGTWPQSGEIDIMEARGNAPPFDGGRNQISSTLHWGPNQATDAYWRTNGLYTLPRTDYSEDFHTYGLEWSDKYMFMYLDSRLLQVFFTKWKTGTSMWNRGEFGTNTNQSALTDPWTWTGRPNTPFDQNFYLILNVAVGGTNGFFVDGYGNKPWVDNNVAAPRAFWNSVGSWLPTWGEGDSRGMTVQSVKMSSLGACK